jgi:hypothetical protein
MQLAEVIKYSDSIKKNFEERSYEGKVFVRIMGIVNPKFWMLYEFVDGQGVCSLKTNYDSILTEDHVLLKIKGLGWYCHKSQLDKFDNSSIEESRILMNKLKEIVCFDEVKNPEELV